MLWKEKKRIRLGVSFIRFRIFERRIEAIGI